MVGYYPLVLLTLYIFHLFGFGISRVMIVLLSLYFGFPLCGVVGVLLVDRIIYKTKEWHIREIVISVIAGCVVGYLGMLLLGRLGTGIVFVLMPLAIAIVNVVCYNAATILGRRN